MADLKPSEKVKLEKLFEMDGGYVLNFSDASFGDFFGYFDIDIHGDRYLANSSKAKKLRKFFKVESDYMVGDIILALIERLSAYAENPDEKLMEECQSIGFRLKGIGTNLSNLKNTTKSFDMDHMNRQIKRLEESVEKDPDLAIGTSKELIETCCKSILKERNITFNEKEDDVVKLVKLTMENLGIVPEKIDPNGHGSAIVKKILGNLAVIAHGMAELRNAYGTGHGKEGRSKALKPRHAKLTVGAASTLVQFLFETHLERK